MLAYLKSFREENKTGFTLIGLLAVILVIGFVAAVAVPMFVGQRASAVSVSTVSNVQTVVPAAVAAGAISFKDSDNTHSPITADGTYTYDIASQSVTYTFDFKNLDVSKTYFILINSDQHQGSAFYQCNTALNQFTLSGGNAHVAATVSLKGMHCGNVSPVLTAPDKVVLWRGYSMVNGQGSADINDAAPLIVK